MLLKITCLGIKNKSNIIVWEGEACHINLHCLNEMFVNKSSESRTSPIVTLILLEKYMCTITRKEMR